MTTEFGPCNDWPVMWTCTIDPASTATTGTAVAMATEILWALSGRQFGTCTVTIRPCRRSCADAPWGWNEIFPGSQWLSPWLFAGQWYNVVCGNCSGDNCSCSVVSELYLPAAATEIVSVKVDGIALLSGAYRLDNNRILVRTDGGTWPLCNDLTRADSQPGTWSVAAKYGRQVPQGGAPAVGELACEINKALNGEDCRLPRRITQLARQGVTIQLPDVNSLFDKGRTGLYLTDLFIAAWNPNGLRQQSRTYSVDGPKLRRPT